MPAIETFGMNLLAGRHLILAGSKHEILQGLTRPSRLWPDCSIATQESVLNYAIEENLN
jgi:hypothetical protein